MKLQRIPRIFLFVFVMLVLWLGLGVVQQLAFWQQHQPSWGAIYFFVSLGKSVLMFGIVICTIAGLIALALNKTPTETRPSSEKQPIHAGPIAVLIFATLLTSIGAIGVWDAFRGRGGSGEWSGFGDFVMLVTLIPGGLAVLVLTVFLRSFNWPARIACIVLSLAAIGLALLMPAVEGYKRKQHENEINGQINREIEKMGKARKEPDTEK